MKHINTTVEHSLTKDAWNVVGTDLGEKYKVARVPYFVVEGDDILTTLNKNEDDRTNLEWLVYLALTSPDPIISISRGRELLGFTYMEEMREWMRNYNGEESVQE